MRPLHRARSRPWSGGWVMPGIQKSCAVHEQIWDSWRSCPCSWQPPGCHAPADAPPQQTVAMSGRKGCGVYHIPFQNNRLKTLGKSQWALHQHTFCWNIYTYIYIYINWRTCIHTYITLHCITLHYITLHDMTWRDMTWHYITYIHSYIHTYMYTSSTAQGGGGSFKNRKPIGEVGCCESRMAQRSHWWTERWLRSLLFLSLFLSLSLTIYLPTHLSIYASIYLSLCRVVQCGVISVV